MTSLMLVLIDFEKQGQDYSKIGFDWLWDSKTRLF